MIREPQTVKLDNLSTLKQLLRKLEPSQLAYDKSLRQAREGLIGALRTYSHSRYDLGRALRAYREYFKVERAWMEAAKVIAAAIDRDEKTVFRIIEAYEKAAQLPAMTIKVMLDQDIDPAAAKHARVVEKLLRIPEPKTSEEAAADVTEAFRTLVLEKAKQASAKPDLEAFAERIVKQFEDRYRSAAPQQRDAEVQYILELLVNTLRAPIRELRQFGRPTLVPKPPKQGAA
jgi:hypothetical protein